MIDRSEELGKAAQKLDIPIDIVGTAGQAYNAGDTQSDRSLSKRHHQLGLNGEEGSRYERAGM